MLTRLTSFKWTPYAVHVLVSKPMGVHMYVLSKCSDITIPGVWVDVLVLNMENTRGARQASDLDT